jgi:putative DNA primase/helicase
MGKPLQASALRRALDEGFQNGDILIEEANLPDVTDKAVKVLQQPGSMVFQRGDVVVGFVGDEELRDHDKPYRLVVLDADALAQRVNRSGVNTWRKNRKTGEFDRCNFPPKIAATILSERSYTFARLSAVAETPLLLPGGRYLDAPGFDPADGLLLHFDPAAFPAEHVAKRPSDASVRAAVDALKELVRGFPFEDQFAEAAALAYLMTAVLRPGMVLAPGFAITARAPGTGKTHLQRTGAWLAVGRDVGVTAWPADEVELRKLLLSMLLGGDPILSIDNLNGFLRSDTLCVLFTSPTYQQRLLGANEAVSVPTRVTVAANGNNLTVAGDLVRRLIVCRMDAKEERPECRAFSDDPLSLVARDRARYVHAVLTIARAYQACADGERPDLQPFAGFAQWCELVREPMVWAGLPDPVATVEASAALDPDRLQLEAMALAVRDVFGFKPWQASRLVAEARLRTEIDSDEQRDKRSTLMQAIRDVAEIGHEISNKKLGKWLASVEGRIVGGLRFVKAEERGRAGITYRLDSAL